MTNIGTEDLYNDWSIWIHNIIKLSICSAFTFYSTLFIKFKKKLL